MKVHLTVGAAALWALWPAAVSAHSAGGAHIGGQIGLMHPFTGLDHILAMIAVGLFASQLGGRSIWALPMAFILAMVAGGAIGYGGVPLPMVEQGIAFSVVAMGLIVALGFKLPTLPAAALVAVFAVFHGHAHGAEGAGAAAFADYAAGFAVATAALLCAGVLLGQKLNTLGATAGKNAHRLLGTAGALSGAAIFLG